MTVTRFKTSPRMSQAVVHGDTVYTAGQVAEDLDADVKGQTEQVLAKIDGLLADAGTDKSKLLSATIWLADMATFNEMNPVWDSWVSPGNTPARACVEARLAQPGYKVEIAVIAAV